MIWGKRYSFLIRVMPEKYHGVSKNVHAMASSCCFEICWTLHCSDAIIGAMASKISSLTGVYSIVYSGAYQRKQQSSASLAVVRGIHRSPHKWPVKRKMLPIWWRHYCDIQNSNSKLKKKRFIETHRHIQQRYIRSLYNCKHSLEIVLAGTPRDKSAIITSKRRCDVVPTQNDATITPRVRREWHVIYKDISHSTWITCVSMRVNRSPEAYTALNYDLWSNPDSNVCRANVVPTSVQLTSLSEDRILHCLCDVALVVKATTSARYC